MVEFRSTGRAGLVSGPTEGAPVWALVDGQPRRVTRTASGAFFARDR